MADSGSTLSSEFSLASQRANHTTIQPPCTRIVERGGRDVGANANGEPTTSPCVHTHTHARRHARDVRGNFGSIFVMVLKTLLLPSVSLVDGQYKALWWLESQCGRWIDGWFVMGEGDYNDIVVALEMSLSPSRATFHPSSVHRDSLYHMRTCPMAIMQMCQKHLSF